MSIIAKASPFEEEILYTEKQVELIKKVYIEGFLDGMQYEQEKKEEPIY